jgi:hypothetical protein
MSGQSYALQQGENNLFGWGFGDLVEEGGEAGDEAVEIGQSGGEASAIRIGKAAVILLKGESFGEEAKEAAIARVEALPEATFFGAILAEPFFAGGGGAAGCRFSRWCERFGGLANHGNRE